MSLFSDLRVAQLATVDAAGRPNGVPVCFALVKGLVVTPIDDKPKSGRPLARLRNIAANPNVCLTLDLYDEDWTKLAWLQVRGTASVLNNGELHAAAVSALRAKYEQYRDMQLDDRPVIVIRPERLVSWAAAAGQCEASSRTM